MKSIFVILGNQLFEPKLLQDLGCNTVFMAEDFDLCSYEKHHKLKLYLFLCAMREYKKELESLGISVGYFALNDRIKNQSYLECLVDYVLDNKIEQVNVFEIEDKDFESELLDGLTTSNIKIQVHQSPMFLFSREELYSLMKDKKTLRMGNFYQHARKKFNILMDENNKPLGGKWSFDAENRKKIPANTFIPDLPNTKQSLYHDEVCSLIQQHFNDHPGSLDNPWFPVNRSDAERQFEDFLKQRMANFGIYEDAMLEGKNFLFHSCISASMNVGLLSPQKVIQTLLDSADTYQIPMNSLEGFVRQVLGWREFIRGVYQTKGDYQYNKNYWGHTGKLTSSWYEGSTGIAPLDDSIITAIQDGYNHHIPRLMVISNLMNLCEIDPKEIYRWFMEMYIDSSEWVMVPNVFGMATYSDGGLMSTKPYTCGSNYLLKMSNYKKGEWCNTVDGLYWRFIQKNRKFYESNPRLSLQPKLLDRMSQERKELIFGEAEKFIEIHTR
ncbi:MAG: cryptochrome/photolyase family protein [Gammaproteobacteria bacterium]|nr:cryptochrome/photolyase family protein [Gammaproteobacteria bacterium]MBT8008754.1 cryptochrome/photolyase family protein [Gammaproteobacteria bacterium]